MINNLKNIPKIDKLISNSDFKNLNPKRVAKIAKEVIESLRIKLKNNPSIKINEEEIRKEILDLYFSSISSSLQPLINATGIIIHTNLGRSLIGEEIYSNIKEKICSYSNLEYDLEKGSRGERYSHLDKYMQELLNVKNILVVNNNAAAVFLILNTFSKNKESIVSRGELIEIGGSFRMPEVMLESGAKLKEIGTTNKTHLKDYKNAINENTAILMKVHRSNFEIEGFTSEVGIEEISNLANENNLISYYDLGSGFLGDLPYGLMRGEESLEALCKTNINLISFSGDKLFGGVQAGIIIGQEELISKLKKNQLLRMLRVDKINIAILEETLKAYIENKQELIPTVNLLNRSIQELRKIAENFKEKIGNDFTEIINSNTYMGGGTMPNKKIPTIALAIKGNPIKLEKIFRENFVIGRIENDKFLIDFRSIPNKDEEQLMKIILKVKRMIIE